MPSRNPSCERCGSTMHRTTTTNGEFWICIKSDCRHLIPVIWVA